MLNTLSLRHQYLVCTFRTTACFFLSLVIARVWIIFLKWVQQLKKVYSSAWETLLFQQACSSNVTRTSIFFLKYPSVHSFRLSSKSSNYIHVKSCSLLILPTPFSTWCPFRIHMKWSLNPYVLMSGCVTGRKCIHDNRRGEEKNESARIFHAVIFFYSKYCSKFIPIVNIGNQSLYFNVPFLPPFSGSKGNNISSLSYCTDISNLGNTTADELLTFFSSLGKLGYCFLYR